MNTRILTNTNTLNETDLERLRLHTLRCPPAYMLCTDIDLLLANIVWTKELIRDALDVEESNYYVDGDYVFHELQFRNLDCLLSTINRYNLAEQQCGANTTGFIESDRDNKALAGIDLWKETYDLIQLGLADIEDNTGIQFLDAMLTKYDSIIVSAEDMLDYSPFVTKTTFDCKPAAMVTTALPSEYVEKELKARIDRLVLATADSCKLEKLSFVMFGNSGHTHSVGSLPGY
jgi:hypothetical protein